MLPVVTRHRSVRGFGLDEFMLALDGNRGTSGDTKHQHMARHVARLVQVRELSCTRRQGTTFSIGRVRC